MRVELLFCTDLIVAIIAGRECYHSMEQSDSDPALGADVGASDREFLSRIIKNGHESVIEHIVYSFQISRISRVCSHQLVRHRIASYSQVSQRRVTVEPEDFIFPLGITEEQIMIVDAAYEESRKAYDRLRELGVPRETARYVLPNGTATSLVMTINARSLRNFFKQRTDKHVQREMRDLAWTIYGALPQIHKFLFLDVLHTEV